jgi:excisionase family DNA binding protein
MDERLLTIKELADLFQISRSTAYRLKKEQRWPHIRFGTEIRFSQENVEAIKALNAQTPAPEPRRAPRVGTRANRRKQ